MHYYDDEITLGKSDVNPLSTMKVKRISRADTNTVNKNNGNDIISKYQNQMECTSDDDGLMRGIISNANENYQTKKDNDLGPAFGGKSTPFETYKEDFSKHQGLKDDIISPSINIGLRINEKCTTDETSDSESEKDLPLIRTNTSNTHSCSLNITPDKWENLPIVQDIKNVFTYILKYTPQYIETVYHMQSFIPDYVPAVGDIDAFLKVTTPPTKADDLEKYDVHLRKIGFEFLDEPSGNQTEPTLLNIKLRSMLTSNYAKSRAAFTFHVPIARTVKDIDKWISEVDQIHKLQSIFDIPLRKDIDRMIIEWPRSYSLTYTNNAYHQCIAAKLTLQDYIRTLCQHLNIEGELQTKADYLLSVQTLFALYLAASQAWE